MLGFFCSLGPAGVSSSIYRSANLTHHHLSVYYLTTNQSIQHTIIYPCIIYRSVNPAYIIDLLVISLHFNTSNADTGFIHTSGPALDVCIGAHPFPSTSSFSVMRQNHKAKDLTSFLPVLDPPQTHPSFPPTEEGTGAALGPRDTHCDKAAGTS